MYEFSSKRLYVLLICLVALGFLTFSAGVITGLGLAMPTREEVAMLKTAHAPKLAVPGEPPHLPTAIPPVSLQTAAAPVAALALPPAAPAKPEQPAAPPAPEHAVPQPQTSAPAPSAETTSQPPAAAVASAAAPQSDANIFALQLGSFRDLNHAKQLQTELKDRGYATSIMTALDSDQREWHLVRIEGFKTLASASQAAQELIGKERIPAVVRRSKSL